ncbi:MAG TPA: endonuclease V [Gemmataceae bacterium]|nr:endonuclease V [Gemmataceae bacterium]
MKITPLHSWDLDPGEAIELQRQLAGRIDVSTPVDRCELIAGADISYNRFSNTFYAGVVVLRTSDWTVIETQGAVGESNFPYIPGLLSFREGPILLKAFAKLQSEPDVVMFDGQGLAHPRRFGLACHMGLWLDRPSLGCAKSLLTGRYKDLDRKAGATAPLTAPNGEILGRVVRTKTGVQPVYVSAGHKIDLDSAVKVVLASCRGYRIPEPTRQAHLHVNELRRKYGG